MQSEFPAEAGVPDRIPDELVEKYGREAKKTVKHNLSRRSRWARRSRRAEHVVQVPGTTSDLWQTTAVVFSLSVIALCGLGGLLYAMYLWPKIGISLTVGVIGLFTFSYLLARRLTRRQADSNEDSVSLY